MMINNPAESFDYYPVVSRPTLPLGDRPVFTVTIGQGLPRVIHPTYVEFVSDIVCQKISIRCHNANVNDFIFDIEGPYGRVMGITNGDTVTLRRVTYFTASHYTIVAHYDGGSIPIARIAVSWASRIHTPSIRGDMVALLAIQGDENIALPPRTFWDFYSRIGEGITDILEKYRETGSLPCISKKDDTAALSGISSILENGSDDQINAVITNITGADSISPMRFRLRTNRGQIRVDELVADMSILYGYEYHVDASLFMYFRT